MLKPQHECVNLSCLRLVWYKVDVCLYVLANASMALVL